MIDIYQLEQLVAFAEEGTLLSAAEKLHISQPALSKSMKKLEDEMGVILFVREKNKLSLNDTGEVTVSHAKLVLSAHAEMINSVQEYDRRKRTIHILSCAPYPMWEIARKVSSANPGCSVITELAMPDVIEAKAKLGVPDIAILPYSASVDGYKCDYWGEENLGFTLPLSHPLASKDTISFKDLDGEKILVFSEIGFWDDIHKRNMPNTEFIYMNNRDDIRTIVSMSEIPTFFTREASGNLTNNRKGILINDKDAHVEYYTLISALTPRTSLFASSTGLTTSARYLPT